MRRQTFVYGSLAAGSAGALPSIAGAGSVTAGDLLSARGTASRLVVLHAPALLTSFEAISARRLEAFRPLTRRDISAPDRLGEAIASLRAVRLSMTADQIDARWLLIAYDRRDRRLGTLAVDAGSNTLASGSTTYLVASPTKLASLLQGLIR